MKKQLKITSLLMLFIATSLFSACSKDDEIDDPIVGKWFIKKYVEVYYNPNGTKGGEASTTDFDNNDFITFKANGEFENYSGISKYTKAGDKVTVTGKTNKTYTVKVLTEKELQLLSTTTDKEDYRYEVTLTLQK